MDLGFIEALVQEEHSLEIKLLVEKIIIRLFINFLTIQTYGTTILNFLLTADNFIEYSVVIQLVGDERIIAEVLELT